MEHPHIDPALQTDESADIAQEFAEQVFDTLSSYCVLYEQYNNEHVVTRPVTGRADIISSDPTVHAALRLTRVPAFCLSNAMAAPEQQADCDTSDDEQEDDEYIVVSLEYGTLAANKVSEERQIFDFEFSWEAYVLAVANKNTLESFVLDGQTGELLSDGDIVQALYAAALLHRNLRAQSYQELLQEDDAPIAINVLEGTYDSTYQPFDTGEIIGLNYEQHVCVPGCLVKTHQDAMSN